MNELTIVRTRGALRTQVRDWRASGQTVALVPTMGALHVGHLSLVDIGRHKADRVVATLFVNPSQFAPSEDFEAYPRDETRDAELLGEAGCDLLYAPGVAEIYPRGFSTTVSVSGVTAGMEGALRPSHFSGVATVVTKLLVQSEPHFAVFGEKDFQQLQTIRRLAADLDLPVEIVPGPTVRDRDGLALSSRNAYLSPGQRAVAPQLHLALRRAAAEIASGEPVASVRAKSHARLIAAGFDSVDYFELRRVEDLSPVETLEPGLSARILAAARLGRTRLLDNVAL